MLLLRLTLLLSLLLYGGVLAAAYIGTWLPPDQIAYEARKSRENYDLHLLDVRWRVDVALTRTPYGERAPAWSPDGTQLAFAANVTGNWELYTLDLTDPAATPRQLTDDDARAMNPAWSPDGTQLAYDSSRDGNLELYLMPVNAPQAAQRLTQAVGADERPAWSPDGAQLAFASYRDNDQDIYLLDIATGDTRNLTDNIADSEWGAAWSPDGATLTFTSSRETFWQVYAIPPDTPESVTPLTAFAEDVAATGWSPDGAWLAVELYDHTGTRSLYRLPANATQQREHRLQRLTLGPSDDRAAVWRPR
jgi:Tol biopolymer transport system component